MFARKVGFCLTLMVTFDWQFKNHRQRLYFGLDKNDQGMPAVNVKVIVDKKYIFTNF